MNARPTATASDVADYFLNYDSKSEESGEGITHLKLQKLVYYAQGFALVILGRPLFGEKIEAWAHGPIIPSLYRKYKGNDRNPVPAPLDFDASEHFTEDEIELLDEVREMYGKFSAWKLRDMIHTEPTWMNNKDTEGEISHKEFKAYFATLVGDYA